MPIQSLTQPERRYFDRMQAEQDRMLESDFDADSCDDFETVFMAFQNVMESAEALAIARHWSRWYFEELQQRGYSPVRMGRSEPMSGGTRMGLQRRRAMQRRNAQPPLSAFGVEAEFFGTDSGTAVQVLQDAGLQAEDEGYHHNVSQNWRITEDGSVNFEGLELVSPILVPGRNPEVGKATKALREAGAKVDTSCGLHVHHNAAGMSTNEVANTVTLYGVFQGGIDLIMPHSRHNAGYSRPIDDPLNWRTRLLGMSNSDFRRECEYAFGRYHHINLNALHAHNTLEFRQHSGTLNATKIRRWVEFTKLIIKKAKEPTFDVVNWLHADFDNVGSAHEWYTRYPHTMLTFLDASSTLHRYWDRRSAALAGNRPDDEIAEGEQNSGRDPNLDHDSDAEDEDNGQWCDNCEMYHYDSDY